MNRAPRQRIVVLDRATVAPQIRLRAPFFDHEFAAYDATAPGRWSSA